MVNQGAWTNTPTAKGKVTIPAGYHNGSGYVDTTTVYNKGVTDADARANANSTNYQTGYNAGVAAADGRANANSANYQAGYNAGKPQGTVLSYHNSFNDDGSGALYASTLSYTTASSATIMVYAAWDSTSYQERDGVVSATVTCSNGTATLISSTYSDESSMSGKARLRTNIYIVNANANATITTTTPKCSSAHITYIK